MARKVGVIGSGFAGLSAAAMLAKSGIEVSVFEKNEMAGGRASVFSASGFTYDMGPSWYWMPDVFEKFYNQFGYTASDFYDLRRLSPSYRVYFGKNDFCDLPSSEEDLYQLFEQHEKGSAQKLRKFLAQAEAKYKIGMHDFVYRPSKSVTEFIAPSVFAALFKMQLFTSVRSHIHGLFKNERLRYILEFPSYFLGALPQNTPAMYSLMNYADLRLGSWYPMGGMYEVIKAMKKICDERGVHFRFNEAVQQVVCEGKNARKLITSKGEYPFDAIISGADYHHTESVLLAKEHRQYTEQYWAKKDFAPSSLIFYLGINKKLNGLLHHNLFFDESITAFANDIYVQPQWPSSPLFYVCCPSKTDASVAPEHCENLFVLMPVAPGLNDTEEVRGTYFKQLIARIEKITGEQIMPHIVYKKSFAQNDFTERYNSYKGHAYGLANTLRQTAFLKPRIKNKRMHNMYYAGQLTVPGPGVPPSIISGQVVAKEVINDFIKQ